MTTFSQSTEFCGAPSNFEKWLKTPERHRMLERLVLNLYQT